jgi:hypothetical protein
MVEGRLLGVAWSLIHALRAGEPPSTSVPTLNSRIILAGIGDIGVDGTARGVGEGVAGARRFVERLSGIGFRGFMRVGPDGLVGPPESSLPQAAGRIREWIRSGQPAVKPVGTKTAK